MLDPTTAYALVLMQTLKFRNADALCEAITKALSLGLDISVKTVRWREPGWEDDLLHRLQGTDFVQDRSRRPPRSVLVKNPEEYQALVGLAV